MADADGNDPVNALSPIQQITTAVYDGVTPLWFPARYPTTAELYSLDFSALMETGEFLSQATVAMAPSGTGEATPGSLSWDGLNILTIKPVGGQPTRVYTALFVLVTTNARTLIVEVEQGTIPLLLTDTPQIPPVVGFGTPIQIGPFVFATDDQGHILVDDQGHPIRLNI